MKMNGYSFTPRRIFARLAAAVLMLALFCTGGTVAYAETPTVHTPVSSADISSSDVLSGDPADFTRVVSVPVNINIPDFYQLTHA